MFKFQTPQNLNPLLPNNFCSYNSLNMNASPFMSLFIHSLINIQPHSCPYCEELFKFHHRDEAVLALDHSSQHLLPFIRCWHACPSLPLASSLRAGRDLFLNYTQIQQCLVLSRCLFSNSQQHSSHTGIWDFTEHAKHLFCFNPLQDLFFSLCWISLRIDVFPQLVDLKPQCLLIGMVGRILAPESCPHGWILWTCSLTWQRGFNVANGYKIPN